MNDKEKGAQINFFLNKILEDYLEELKNFSGINSNNEMVRNCISIAWLKMKKKKKELGIDQLLQTKDEKMEEFRNMDSGS